MSIRSFFKVLLPFASSAAADVDAEVAAIQSKANADIAAVKLKAGQRAQSAALQAKHANWQKFSRDYEAYLRALNPTPAPSGSTGPTGA